MNGLMWFLLLVMLAMLLLSLLWLIWKLRNFSQSQNQTLDDKLLQAMLSDADLSGKIKEALVKKSRTAEREETSSSEP